MPKVTPTKIVPNLWFADKAVEAANFYVSLFPDSRVDSVTPIRPTPSGPAGSVQVIEFTLAGQKFMAINAGPWTRSTTPSRSSELQRPGRGRPPVGRAVGRKAPSSSAAAQGPLRPLLADCATALGELMTDPTALEPGA